MPLAIDDILQVKWRGSCNDQEIQLQQTYKVASVDTTVGTLAALFGIASYFANDVAYGGPSPLTIAYLNMLGSGYQLYAVDVQKLLPSKTIYVRKTTATNGTGGTGSKATNTAATFTLTSAAPGRSQLAKYHPGPLPDAFMSGGNLSAPALSNLQALGSQATAIQTLMLVAAGDTTLQPVILHRNPNANPRTVNVASFRINYYVRTQRRRTNKIGK